MLYQNLIRPLLFRFSDPEKIHGTAIQLLDRVSKNYFINKTCKKILQVQDKKLNILLGNLRLENPVGLAAGFDKHVSAPLAYPMLGFGWAELGSITYNPQPGNLKPRLWRLPQDKGLIVHYGLANDGAVETMKRFNNIGPHTIPYGISIAPTNGLWGETMIDDYLKTFQVVKNLADYITLNVSCPNVAGESIFSQLSFIRDLLNRLSQRQKLNRNRKDVFIKISSRMSENDLFKIVEYCLQAGITGIVATNLLKNKNHAEFKSSLNELDHPGGISGKRLQVTSTETIRSLYRLAQGKLCIVGVGGIFTAEDAYEKIKAGATAVQVITGFIYGGPSTIHSINKGLLTLLKKDGFKNISEAIGIEA